MGGEGSKGGKDVGGGDVEGWEGGGGVSPALQSLSTQESLHVSCCSCDCGTSMGEG